MYYIGIMKRILIIIYFNFLLFNSFAQNSWLFQETAYPFNAAYYSVEIPGQNYITLVNDTNSYYKVYGLNQTGGLNWSYDIGHHNPDCNLFLQQFIKKNNSCLFFGIHYADSLKIIEVGFSGNVINTAFKRIINPNYSVNIIARNNLQQNLFLLYDKFIYKLDSNYNTLWLDSIHLYNSSEQIIDAETLLDSGVVVLSGSNGMDSIVFRQYNKTGTLISTKFISSSCSVDWNFGQRKVLRPYKNGYLVEVSTYSLSTYQTNVIRLNSAGDTLWSKRAISANSNYVAADFVTDATGNFVLSSNNRITGDDMYLIKCDSQCNVLWTKTYNLDTLYGNHSYALLNTSDKGYLITGYTGDWVWTSHSFVLKLDSSGLGNYTGIKTFDTQHSIFQIYPNPNNGNFIIEPNNAIKQTMQVYDVNGKMVLSQTINGRVTIEASALNEGVYNISLISNEAIVNKRLVIVK